MIYMDDVLRPFARKCVIFYLDEILIFSQTKEEHLRHLKYVLDKMKREKLLINTKKCTFMQKVLVYLRFIISDEGLKMDPKKVEAILYWPHNTF